jgi:hypothetical protein
MCRPMSSRINAAKRTRMLTSKRSIGSHVASCRPSYMPNSVWNACPKTGIGWRRTAAPRERQN